VRERPAARGAEHAAGGGRSLCFRRELWHHGLVPALSAPLLGFALGAGLYWSAARELARPIRPVAGASLLVATILGLFVYAPAIALLLEAEPDWGYAYLVPAEALPRWLRPWLILMSAASVPLGFGAALRVCRGRVSFVKSWFWVPAAAGLLPLAAASPRLAVQASFEQFHGDFGVHQLIGGPLGYLLLWSLLGIGIATWLARRCLGFLALGGAHGS
jgi:hypothetical protein